MLTIARNRMAKLAEIRDAITHLHHYAWDKKERRWVSCQTWGYINRVVTVADAFEVLARYNDARLIEHEPGQTYTITYGGTRETGTLRRTIVLVATPITAGMKGITFHPDHNPDLTVPVDVIDVQAALEDDTPAAIARIDHDGVELTVPTTKLRPEPWIWTPSPEYLAEQARAEESSRNADEIEQGPRTDWLVPSTTRYTLRDRTQIVDDFEVRDVFANGNVLAYDISGQPLEGLTVWDIEPVGPPPCPNCGADWDDEGAVCSECDTILCECGEPVDGDGYDGKCGTCADIEYRSEEEEETGPRTNTDTPSAQVYVDRTGPGHVRILSVDPDALAHVLGADSVTGYASAWDLDPVDCTCGHCMTQEAVLAR
ncbi:hypothetical protein [Nonomuraea typhae]|uniref:hypothetical protein n=1 Tax=Nonomuraea typhae TaxID=2603600 RepID=UPI0012F8E391|nr:hypothetical protein [Nonomuraea typhae]